MTIKHKFTLMCDEVRQENNGKFLILGLYTPNMTIMSLPAVVPSLTFFQYLEADRPGTVTQKVSLQSLETGKTIASTTNMINIQPQGDQPFPMTVLNAIGFRSVMFDRAGTYSFNVTFEGQSEPIIYQFDVILQLPNQPVLQVMRR